MQVILTQEVSTLGSIGQVVTVKNGYARNFLLPRSMAVAANKSNRKELEHHMRVLAAKKAKFIAAAKEMAKTIEKLSLKIAKQVGEDERIFGSVTTTEIHDLMQKEGVDVPRKDLSIVDEVKKVGVYTGEAKLHPEVTAKFKFWVVAQS